MKNLLLLISLALALLITKSDIHTSENSQPTIVSVICAKDPTAVEGYRKSREKFKLNELERQKKQFLVLLKSLLISKEMVAHTGKEVTPLEYILITNRRAIFDEVNNTVAEWSPKFTKWLRLTYLPVEYPAEYKFTEVLFAPCATFRHLLSTILPEKDAIIYLDTDVIVFQDIQDLWKTASRFQVVPEALLSAASAPNTPIPKVCIPPITERPGHSSLKRPINSGVMLMNLTRILQSDMLEWLSRLEPYWKSFRNCGDQDLVSLYLKPSQLLPMDCMWNCRPQYFGRKLECGTKIRILHGNAGFFWRNDTRLWNSTSGITIFKLFEDLQLNDDLDTKIFVNHIKSTLNSQTQDYCIENGNASFECKARKLFSQAVFEIDK